MKKSYTTQKGTELPILNLKGKEYLEVKFRIVWFREDHPNWSIETELISVTDTSAYARATIRDEHGRIIATSHKFENVKGFADFIEKSETGAIGRALALIGYGTQFCADELDEGKRIVDGPISKAPQSQKPAEGKPVNKERLLKAVEEVKPLKEDLLNGLVDLVGRYGKTDDQFFTYISGVNKRDIDAYEDMTEDEIKTAIIALNQFIDNKAKAKK